MSGHTRRYVVRMLPGYKKFDDRWIVYDKLNACAVGEPVWCAMEAYMRRTFVEREGVPWQSPKNVAVGTA